MFIVSLCLADFCIGLVAVPTATIVLYTDDLNLDRYKYGCLITWSLLLSLIGVSVSSLATVAADRLFYIERPFQYEQFISCNMAVGICIVIWISMWTWSFTPTMGWTNWTPASTSCALFDVVPYTYSCIMLLYITTCLVFAIVAYSIIFYTAWKQRQKINSVVNSVTPALECTNRHSHEYKYRYIKMMFITVGVFCACWIPNLIWHIIRLYNRGHQPFWMNCVGHFTALGGIGNFMMNPIVFRRLNRAYRNAFRKILGLPLHAIRTSHGELR